MDGFRGSGLSEGNLAKLISNALFLQLRSTVGIQKGHLAILDGLPHLIAHPIDKFLPVQWGSHKPNRNILCNRVAQGVEGVIEDPVMVAKIAVGGLVASSS